MDNNNFPIFKTKIEGVTRKFDLSDPQERREYFDAKAGDEIKEIQEYLKDNTFVAYLLGKKNSGKGTYTKLFMEAVGKDRVAHISVGDVVREVGLVLQDEKRVGEKEEIVSYLKNHYRGFQSLDSVIEALGSRSQDKLLPTELILALIKWELDKLGGRAVFIDGFPRDLDQVSYSLFFRDLIGYRYDPDLFVFINIPETVIDERMKSRVVCPKCKTPRGLKLLATKEVGYDNKESTFYLKCDSQECGGERMISKEGDEAGIESVRARLEKDDVVMEKVMGLEGIPKVFLRNSIPVDKKEEYIDDYEITPAYSYKLEKDGKTVKTLESSWIIKDDDGTPSHSLLAPPVVLSLLGQIAKILKEPIS